MNLTNNPIKSVYKIFFNIRSLQHVKFNESNSTRQNGVILGFNLESGFELLKQYSYTVLFQFEERTSLNSEVMYSIEILNYSVDTFPQIFKTSTLKIIKNNQNSSYLYNQINLKKLSIIGVDCGSGLFQINNIDVRRFYNLKALRLIDLS